MAKKKKVIKKKKDKKCGNCFYFHNPECWLEAPTLFLILANRYMSIGYPREKAIKKTFFLCEPDKGHVCKRWKKKNEKNENKAKSY